MEQWEVDLRARLEKELPDGYYELSGGEGGFCAGTGKGGKIEFEVALVKAAKNWKPDPIRLPRKTKKRLKNKREWDYGGWEYQIRTKKFKRKKQTQHIGEATMDDFADMMKMLQQNSNNL